MTGLNSLNSFISYSGTSEKPVRISLVRGHDSTGSRAVANIGGKLYGCDGPCPIYRISTLMYLDGYRGRSFEVHDNRSPTGGPGGLAMYGTVRNWARCTGSKVTFEAKAKPDAAFTPDQEASIRRTAGGNPASARLRLSDGVRATGRHKGTERQFRQVAL